ncbi:MAG: undecaprenyl-diphosphate phosphatase [Acidimicrobiaceae bacterium]|nr:undecaprenyl-diphosphate phosphatase [Acidimicrobiaceae bacterium]
MLSAVMPAVFPDAAATAPHIYHLNFLQAIVIGLIQGFFELFPLSSLGHTVLIPSWIGGTWATLVRQESLAESPYLAFIVGLHLANAVALLAFYLPEWARIIAGFFRSLIRRRIENDTERLAWLIVIATIPVGLLGLRFEHQFRTLFAKPLAAAIFLCCNGVILFAGEWYRRHHLATAGQLSPAPPPRATARATRFRDRTMVSIDRDAIGELSRIGWLSTLIIGASQALALLAGISREGVVMVGGLFRGLTNENAMRFAFLLSTPVIFAAGALKVPDLAGPHGNGIRGQVAAGSLAAVLTSLLALAFLTRYFKTRTLIPFAVYSLAFGLASVIRFGLF